MNIAIQASDLDSERIDGTRIYIYELLKRFGALDPEASFFIYHKKEFNRELTPPHFTNYSVVQKDFPFFWTQTRFTLELLKNNHDSLWMPMHALPFVRPRKLKTTVTIHDLAFNIFPEYFPRSDRRRLTLLTHYAVNHADNIFAVSQSTKKDILTYYPDVPEKKIHVIHHGYTQNYKNHYDAKVRNTILRECMITPSSYILYVGAIQPRKNIITLVKAFEKLKKNDSFKHLKLVLAGGLGWMWNEVFETIEHSTVKKDIVVTKGITQLCKYVLFKNASLFVWPSLYEGFGIPILEAMDAGLPVILGDNSSHREIAGDAGVYTDIKSPNEVARSIKTVLEDNTVYQTAVKQGRKNLQRFSWDQCAKDSLAVIKQ